MSDYFVYSRTYIIALFGDYELLPAGEHRNKCSCHYWNPGHRTIDALQFQITAYTFTSHRLGSAVSATSRLLITDCSLSTNGVPEIRHFFWGKSNSDFTGLLVWRQRLTCRDLKITLQRCSYSLRRESRLNSYVSFMCTFVYCHECAASCNCSKSYLQMSIIINYVFNIEEVYEKWISSFMCIITLNTTHSMNIGYMSKF